ncbi:unnamed protein product [Auanema sp. JU1783]|nr:unnamed protein product [Auanema sp. JU1783]
MQIVDMLQAEIHAAFSRITASISTFRTVAGKVSATTPTQELLRNKRQLIILLEEVDHNVKKIDINRNTLIDLKFNDWSMKLVDQYDLAQRRLFKMKDIIRQLDDNIEISDDKHDSSDTITIKEECNIKTECPDDSCPRGPQPNEVTSQTNSNNVSSSSLVGTKALNEESAEQENKKNSGVAISLPKTADKTKNKAVKNSPEKRRRHKISDSQNKSEEVKASSRSSEKHSRSHRTSSSPLKKRNKVVELKKEKPLVIPTERLPLAQAISPLEENPPRLFDPRSKSYQRWKQAENNVNNQMKNVSFKSYSIPDDLGRFKTDFHKRSDESASDMSKHAPPTVTAIVENSGASFAAVAKKEKAAVSSGDKLVYNLSNPTNPSIPINPADTSSNIIQSKTTAGIKSSFYRQLNNECSTSQQQQTDSVENVETSLPKDDDSDIESSLMEKFYVHSKAQIYSFQLKIIDIQCRLHTESKKNENLDILKKEGLTLVKFYSWAGNEIMKVCEFCAERKDSYEVLAAKMESKNLRFLKVLIQLIDELTELSETSCIVYKTVTKSIDEKIEVLVPYEKYILFERLAVMQGAEDFIRSEIVAEGHERFKMSAKEYDEIQNNENTILPSMSEYIRRIALDSAFNSNTSNIMETGQVFPALYLESYRILSEYEKNTTETTFEEGLNDFKRRFSSWAYAQRAKFADKPAKDWDAILRENSKDLLKYFRGNPNTTSISLKKHLEMEPKNISCAEKIAHALKKDFDTGKISNQQGSNLSENDSIGAAESENRLNDYEIEVAHEVEVEDFSSIRDCNNEESDAEATLVDQEETSPSYTTDDLDSDDVPQPRVLPFRNARVITNKTPLFSANSLLTEDDIDCGTAASPIPKRIDPPTDLGLKPRKITKLSEFNTWLQTRPAAASNILTIPTIGMATDNQKTIQKQ